MNNEQIELILIPSVHDARLESDLYQAELRNFVRLLPENSQVRPVMFAQDTLDGIGGLLGTFLFPFVPYLGDITKAACLSFLSQHSDRQISVKYKDVEVKSHKQDIGIALEALEKMAKLHSRIE